jgi:hypothetical protein
MRAETLFWLIVGVTMTASLLVSAALGYVRQHWSVLVAVLIVSTLALGPETGISVAYGGYLGVIFIPAILAGYLVGRALRVSRLSSRDPSRAGP